MSAVDAPALRERFARALCQSDTEDWRIYPTKADLLLEILMDPTPRMVDAATETGERFGLSFAKKRRR